MAPARDVAVVATAQTVHRRAATELSEVEMIQPVIAEVLDAVGAWAASTSPARAAPTTWPARRSASS